MVRPDLINLDWVRLALPRSPESGVAVSTAGKILSREKRKMWMRFSQSAHILWYVFQSRTLQQALAATEMADQISRNPFMRNLLTVFRRHCHRKKSRKNFLSQISNFFQQLTDELCPISTRGALAAHEFCSDGVGKPPCVPLPCGPGLQESRARSDSAFY